MPFPDRPGPIAFVCAMPMELRPLTKALGLESTTLGGGPAKRGTLDGREVVAIVTGMGTELATAGIRRLLDAVTPAHVLVVGITGAVDDVRPIGSMVWPAVVIDHASGREHEHVLLGGGAVSGAMWTTDVITKPHELPGLVERGVISLDMETAAIALECERQGVPWSVFRAISDRATDGSIDDEVFHLSRQDGTPNPKAVLRYALRHPVKLVSLAKMGKGATLATRAAADAAIAAVRAP
jgi:nucleoside phosphorylase